MEKEIWRPVIGYEDRYEISNVGRFKIIGRIIAKNKRGQRYSPEKITNGIVVGKLGNEYLKVVLTNSNSKKLAFVHRLVAIHFIENPENKPQVNHKDRNRFNNYYKNLEWVTPRENTIHSHMNGGKIFKSKYPGITYIKKNKKWWARATIKGKRNSIGCFDNEEDAYNARIDFLERNNISTKYSKL